MKISKNLLLPQRFFSAGIFKLSSDGWGRVLVAFREMELSESVLMMTSSFNESIDIMDEDLRKGKNKDKRNFMHYIKTMHCADPLNFKTICKLKERKKNAKKENS